jgi:hypothetical protein
MMLYGTLHAFLDVISVLAMLVLPSFPLLLRERPSSFAVEILGARIQPCRRATELQ